MSRLRDIATKIRDRDDLAERLRSDRAAGRTVALANGLFDLLHVGHVRYLEAASREADVLVVAVNSDVSARALKGEGRPILPELERAEIIAALECVDWVCLFSELNVEATLLALRPDVHCKGTDYTRENVPERATVLGYGGRIAIVGDAKDHATRDLIREILRRFGPAGRAP